MSLAGVRRLAVPGELEALLPVGGVQRGSVVTVGGVAGSGATTAALSLAAAATAAGEWAAFVDPGSLGGLAAVEAGVDLERCAIVRAVPEQRWALVVGALLDGITMVVAAAPAHLALGDARRLMARARERQAVLVVLESVPGVRTGAWPAEAALRIHVDGAHWDGLAAGSGRLECRALAVRVEGKGVPHAARLTLARAG